MIPKARESGEFSAARHLLCERLKRTPTPSQVVDSYFLGYYQAR